MDAVKYIKEKHRLCDSFEYCCDKCPINQEMDSSGLVACYQFVSASPEIAVEIIEEWSKEHPIITNEMKFEEIFGVGFGDATKNGIVKFLSEEYKAPK